MSRNPVQLHHAGFAQMLDQNPVRLGNVKSVPFRKEHVNPGTDSRKGSPVPVGLRDIHEFVPHLFMEFPVVIEPLESRALHHIFFAQKVQVDVSHQELQVAVHLRVGRIHHLQKGHCSLEHRLMLHIQTGVASEEFLRESI